MAKWDVMRAKDLKQILGVDEAVVVKSIQQGKIGIDDLLRQEGASEWRRVAELRDWLFMSPTERWEREAALRDSAKATGLGRPMPADHGAKATAFAPATNVLVAKSESSLQPADSHEAEYEEPFARRNMDVEEFDLTPMVDMTFLLNMFFMLTTSYVLLRSIDVPAPNINSKDSKASTQQVQSLDDLRDDYIIAEIRPDNTISIDDKDVSRKDLVESLKARVRETNKNELIVQAADEAYHEIVVAVLDAGNEAGMQRVKLATSAGEGAP